VSVGGDGTLDLVEQSHCERVEASWVKASEVVEVQAGDDRARQVLLL